MKRLISSWILLMWLICLSCFNIWNADYCKDKNDCQNIDRYNEQIDKYNEALKEQDYETCIKALEKAIRFRPSKEKELNELIAAHSEYLCYYFAEQEDYSKSLGYCKKAIAIEEDATTLYNAWFVSVKLKDYGAAIIYLGKAKKISKDPELNKQIDSLMQYAWEEYKYALAKENRKTNDEYGYYQYYLSGINVFEARDKLPEKKHEVVVAVIDDGVNINHPDFKDKIWVNEKEIPWDWIDNDKNGYIDDYNGWDFVNERNNTKPTWTHGTMVAWIIAANANNWIWISGIVPSVKIISLNVFWTDWKAWDRDIIHAVEYAIDKWADIINLSLWGEQFEYSDKYNSVFKKANEKWIVIVAAAGNWDVLTQRTTWVNTTVSKLSPVCNEEDRKTVIWVGSLTKEWNQSQWSNYWSCVDFFMYGEDIFTTAVNPEWEPYLRAAGTSFATPMLVGIIWLWYNKYGKISPDVVYDNLKKSTDWNVINAAKYLDNLSASLWELKSAVSWLYSRWFINTNDTNEFWFTENITREEAAKFFVKYAELFNKDIIINDDSMCIFTDLWDSNMEFRSYVINSCRMGLLTWKNWKFYPKSILTNAQAITIFMRLVSWKKDESWTHYADKYFVEAYRLWLINWMNMWNQSNYEKAATKWEVAILLYRWLKTMLEQMINS